MQAVPLICLFPYTRDHIAKTSRKTTTNIAGNWKQFKQIWDNFVIIMNLTVQTEQERVSGQLELDSDEFNDSYKTSG